MSKPSSLKKPAKRFLRGASVANGLCTERGKLFHLYQYNVTKTVSAVQNAHHHWTFRRSSA